jgi:diaminopimelate epimerase
MKLTFVKADPTGNTTILVLSPVPEKDRAAVAGKLLLLEEGWAEQVGFLSDTEKPFPCLSMMGGEFCGNASLSAAAYLAEQKKADKEEIFLRVSGTDEPVRCAVKKKAGRYYEGSVAMPLPLSVRKESYCLPRGKAEFWTVRLPGITHVVVPEGRIGREEAEKVLPAWAEAGKESAMGMLLWAEDTLAMTPLVYVSGTKSSVWEHGCASGTASAGAYLAVQSGKDTDAEISQPGGKIRVRAVLTGMKCSSLSITGKVKLLGKRELELQGPY